MKYRRSLDGTLTRWKQLVSAWPTKRRASGSDVDDGSVLVDSLVKLLDRETSILSLEALRVATLAPDGRGPIALDPVAIGFDTVAALRLTDSKRTEVVDYLVSRHVGPIVLPGQVIQEFWKNSLAEIQTVGSAVLAKYQSVADQIRKAPIDTTAFSERFDELVQEFATTYGLTYDPNTEQRIAAVLDALERRQSSPTCLAASLLMLRKFERRLRRLRGSGTLAMAISSSGRTSCTGYCSPKRRDGHSTWLSS